MNVLHICVPVAMRTNIIREIAFIWVLVVASMNPIESIVVDTDYGQVRGIVKSYAEGSVAQFKGIPFATPPVGDLRFRKPVPNSKWDTVLDATQFGPSCMQHLLGNDEWLLENKNISEDCLQLNIFIPGGVIDRSHPKAVMVWIHGGGFTAGQATLVDGSYLALHGDVIVVMINYRLGLFGFLSTEDQNAAGNYGLWDQKLGIQWVHDNIEYFGGDSKLVSIFGESAGGYSVGLQSIIPSNDGLFQRVISQSGAVKSPRALAVGARKVAIEAGRLLNCTNDGNITVLVECLRQVGPEELLHTQNNAIHGLDKTDTFLSRLGPVLDNDLIPVEPMEVLSNVSSDSYKFFKSLDVMAGTNNAEGGLMYWMMMKYQKSKHYNISQGISKQALCDVVAPLVADNYYESNAEVSRAICEQYTVPGDNLADQGRSTLNVYADIMFIVPTTETLIAHSHDVADTPNASRTYQYIFTHEPSFPWIQDRPPWLNGANHAGELPFVFGLDSMYKPSSPKPRDEIQLSKEMMDIWTSFAKSGNPKFSSDQQPPQEFTDDNKAYMNFSINPHVENALFNDRMTFWMETVPELMTDNDKPSNSASNLNLSKILTSTHVLVFVLCSFIY